MVKLSIRVLLKVLRLVSHPSWALGILTARNLRSMKSTLRSLKKSSVMHLELLFDEVGDILTIT